MPAAGRIRVGSSSYVLFIVVLFSFGCSSGDSPNSSTSPSSGPPPGSLTNGVLQAHVKASNPGGGFRVGEGNSVSTGDQFGLSVALSGNTLVVGAPHEDSCATGINGDQANNECEGAGAVYVFTRSDGTWRQEAYIKASNTELGFFGDWFGRHVALSGDTLAVSALEEDSCARGINGDQANNGCNFAGAVYVFTRTNGVWTQQAYLKAANTDVEVNHGFGYSLALDGDTLAVGSIADSSCATGINGDPNCDSRAPTGAAYVFTRTNGVWSQQAYFKPAVLLPNVGYDFGYSLALSGDRLAVGSPLDPSCPGEGTSGCPSTGAAYVFTRNNGVWTQEAFLKASNPDINDLFGTTVALSADTLAVTARSEASCARGINGDQANNGCFSSGAVYVFIRANGTWSQQAYVKSSNLESGDFFGSSLAIKGDTLAVGAEHEDSCASGINGNQADNNCSRAGAVYLFNRNAGVWRQEAYTKASNTDAGDAFGGMGEDGAGTATGTVAISDGTLAIGAYRESSCAGGINGNQTDNNCLDAGAVYVYEAR